MINSHKAPLLKQIILPLSLIVLALDFTMHHPPCVASTIVSPLIYFIEFDVTSTDFASSHRTHPYLTLAQDDNNVFEETTTTLVILICDPYAKEGARRSLLSLPTLVALVKLVVTSVPPPSSHEG